MKRFLSFCAIALLATAGCASAQSQSGPSADVRAHMLQARADAKTASWSALSADHQVAVQKVVDGFNTGTLDIPTASSQIDAMLTPDETTAVLAQSKKLRDAMRAAFAANGGGQSGQGAGPGNGQGRSGAGRPQDAGRFLLGLAADQAKWRAAVQAMRDANGGGQGSPP